MLRRFFARAILVTAMALSLGPASVAKGKTVEVEAGGGPVALLWTWNPDSVSIAAGDKVKWLNPTSTLHHVAFYEGPASGTIHVESGGSAKMRFKKPGTYLYRCDIQPFHSALLGGQCFGMCGEVIVE